MSCWCNDENTIQNTSKENLRFNDHSKQVVFLVTEFRKHVLHVCFCRVIETLMKIWKNSKKLWKHVCSQSISHSPKVPNGLFLELDRNTVQVFYLLNMIPLHFVLVLQVTICWAAQLINTGLSQISELAMYSLDVCQILTSIKVMRPIKVVYYKYNSLQQQPGFSLVVHAAVALPTTIPFPCIRVPWVQTKSPGLP